jgi:hypothetical protein
MVWSDIILFLLQRTGSIILFLLQCTVSHYYFLLQYNTFVLKLSGHYLFPLQRTEKVYTVELVSLRRRALRECVNLTNFAFWIKYHFNIDI